MSEYIERQKALDTVFRSHSVEGAHRFLAAIPAADVRPVEWIPVTERLPFDGGKYLCKIKCPKGEWIEIDRWDGEDWYSTDWHEEKATSVVTHWMPLPEPPKEE